MVQEGLPSVPALWAWLQAAPECAASPRWGRLQGGERWQLCQASVPSLLPCRSFVCVKSLLAGKDEAVKLQPLCTSAGGDGSNQFGSVRPELLVPEPFVLRLHGCEQGVRQCLIDRHRVGVVGEQPVVPSSLSLAELHTRHG